MKRLRSSRTKGEVYPTVVVIHSTEISVYSRSISSLISGLDLSHDLASSRFAKLAGRQCVVDRESVVLWKCGISVWKQFQQHDDINRFLRKEVQMSSHIGGTLPFLNSYPR